MKRNQSLTIAAVFLLAVGLISMSACKTNGMAMTSRGQLLKININAPTELPDGGEGNLDVNISNRGVNNIKDVLVDFEAPSQLVVLDQTADNGIHVMHDIGSNVYHFTLGNVQPGETASVRFKVRTAFGTMRETGNAKVTAWQRDLPGDKLIETAVIKLRS